jgi:hypothetical protein
MTLLTDLTNLVNCSSTVLVLGRAFGVAETGILGQGRPVLRNMSAPLVLVLH